MSKDKETLYQRLIVEYKKLENVITRSQAIWDSIGRNEDKVKEAKANL